MEFSCLVSDKEWDAFVVTSPQFSVFVTSDFIKSLNIDYKFFGVYDKKQLQAAAVLLIDKEGKSLPAPYSFSQYQGVLLADHPSFSNHKRIKHNLKTIEFLLQNLSEEYNYFSFCHSWRLEDLRPFLWFNYHTPERGVFQMELMYTGILDRTSYKDFEHYLSKIAKGRKYDYKKAKKNIVVSDSENIDELITLYVQTFQRQGVNVGDKEIQQMSSICSYAIKNRYGALKLASYQGRVISAVFFLKDHRTAYYLFGASDPEYRNTGGASLLLLESIRESFENGIGEIDFVGVNSPHRGDFKLSFNAALKPFYVTTINIEE